MCCILDEVFAASEVSSLNEVRVLVLQSTVRGGELEGPACVCHLAEVVSAREELVDNVLSADHCSLSLLLEGLLHNLWRERSVQQMLCLL